MRMTIGERRAGRVLGLALGGVLSTAALGGAQDAPAPPAEGTPDYPAYSAVSGISGNLNSIGSDTLNNLMTLWAEKFNQFYPNVVIPIEGKGSSTAPPALIEGTAQLGPMSRAMKESEIDQFERKYGWKPLQVRVAVDALAVYVHKDNPIKALTLTQVDAIFGKSRRRGGPEVKTWGDLGLKDAWASVPISLYGRNSASGTYGFFKEIALQNGDFKDTVKEQPGSASVVQGITVDKYGIGYSGIGYTTAGVRAVPLSPGAGQMAYRATEANASSGKYPLTRYLFVYANKAPGRPADPLIGEFFRMVLSREGQQVVVKDGYFPLPVAVVAEERQKLE